MNDLKLVGADLEIGEQARIVCPECGGGSTSERCMSITRTTDGVLFKCFRANCGVQGMVAGRATNLVRTSSDPSSGRLGGKERKAEVFTPNLEHLSNTDMDCLWKRGGLSPAHLDRGGVMKQKGTGRAAFPIYGPVGRRRGYVLRSYSGALPKSLTHMEETGPHTSWYRKDTATRRSEVLVVEDISSALRGSRYVDTIALNGSGGSPETIAEIAAYYRRIRWALDADATTQALKLHKTYALNFERSSVLILEKDLKDMQENDLKELLSE